VLRKAELCIEADLENYLGGSSETICTTSDLTITNDQLLHEGGFNHRGQPRSLGASLGIPQHFAILSSSSPPGKKSVT